MAGLIRLIFGIFASAIAMRIVENILGPKSPPPLEPKAKPDLTPTLDLKPCPVCGVYTAQPATHCKH